jgi:phosphate transport system permease protein
VSSKQDLGRAPAAPLASRRTGPWADRAFRWILVACGLSVLVLLAIMVAKTSADAWPVFRHMGYRFFTDSNWDPGTSRTEITGNYGALAFIYGTLVTSGLAILIAVPLAVGVAMFLTEIAPGRVARPLSYAVELLATVPSVVYGLWGLLFFAPVVLRPVMDFVSRYLGFLPIFEGPVINTSYFVAGMVLAIMILPIITAITREVFAATPQSEREAAYALGATRWEVLRHVVFHRGRAGLVGATMLGLGRALGETIAVALLVGSAEKMSVNLFGQGYSMAAVIANTFQESTPEGIKALLAVGVALFGITMVVNILARLITRRFTVARGEAA